MAMWWSGGDVLLQVGVVDVGTQQLVVDVVEPVPEAVQILDDVEEHGRPWLEGEDHIVRWFLIMRSRVTSSVFPIHGKTTVSDPPRPGIVAPCPPRDRYPDATETDSFIALDGEVEVGVVKFMAAGIDAGSWTWSMCSPIRARPSGGRRTG